MLVKRYYNGNSVVEMAIVMPLVLGVWALVIFALFYYHDKAILQGAAYEAVIVGSELWMDTEDEKRAKIEQYFEERIDGKLLLFQGAESTIEVNPGSILVEAKSVHRRFGVKVKSYSVITEPEMEVRKMQLLKDGMEGEEH